MRIAAWGSFPSAALPLTMSLGALLLAGCEQDTTLITTTNQAPQAVGAPLGIEVLDESDFEPQMSSADPFERLYDANNVSTVRGAVLGMRRVTTRDDRTFLIAEVGVFGEVLDVILAPEDFLSQRGLSIGMTDQIEATGSRTVRNTRDTIIARRVREGGAAADLRDETGRALWQ